MRRSYAHTWRSTLPLALLLMAALACNLGTGDRPPTKSPPVGGTPFLFTPFPTQPVLLITATPYPTLPPTQVIPTQPDCTPYTTWPVYTVIAGDTLGNIAARANTTINQLAAANCLANSNLIYVGQQLFVPQIPATVTPAPTNTAAATQNANAPVFGQALSADQHWRDATGQAVTYYQAVRVTVGEVTNADLVDFYVNNPAGGAAIFIGQDADPWDGAFVDYSFPVPGTYTFQAVAENEFMRLNSPVFTVRYDPNFVPPDSHQYNTLTFTPNLGVQDGWIALQAGATVTIAWPDVPRGAVRVDFSLAPTGTGATATNIGVDHTPIDGATMTWTVPAGLSGHVQATATMPNGQAITSEIASVVSQ